MDNHFEVMWDLFSNPFPPGNPELSVLDEVLLSQQTRDPNFSPHAGHPEPVERTVTDRKFSLSDAGAMEILEAVLHPPDEELYDKNPSQTTLVTRC